MFINGHLLYNPYCFVWIQHIYSANMDFAMDPSNGEQPIKMNTSWYF